jgi:hypothetical protein
MRTIIEASKLVNLAKDLPERLAAVAHASAAAERQLTRILVMRAAGVAVKPSDVAVARMTLARSLRDVEDLQKIKKVLPSLLEQAGVSPQTVRLAAVA